MNSQEWPESLGRLHQRAERLGRLASELTAAIPERAAGSDLTGWVNVALDQTGFPMEMRVFDGWQYRLGPEELGSAVMSAYDHGVCQAMRAWTDQLDDARWWPRRRDADEAPWTNTPPRPSVPSGGRVHGNAECGEPVLRALHAARYQAVEAMAPVEGTSAGRNAIVCLGGGGLIGCEVDPYWARTRDGATISRALTDALAQARSRITGPIRDPQPGVDAALHDARAALAALTGRLPTRGERR